MMNQSHPARKWYLKPEPWYHMIVGGVLIGLVVIALVIVIAIKPATWPLLTGYLFGAVVSVGAYWWLLWSLMGLISTHEKHFILAVISFIFRLVFYAIPLVIAGFFSDIFNIYTTAFGVLTMTLAVMIMSVITAILSLRRSQPKNPSSGRRLMRPWVKA